MAKKGLLAQVALCALVLCSALVVANPQDGLSLVQEHDPIYIYGDQGFTRANGVVAGCGTREDPYVIEGWHIVPQLASYGIYVDHTSRFFIIRNCVIERASCAAIHFNSVSNGRIEGCLLVRNDTGVRLENAQRNTLIGNLFADNRCGVLMAMCSQNNVLTLNSFLGNRSPALDQQRGNAWCSEGRGNYWCSHPCSDRDGNGICDEPFTLVGDPCPLVVSPIACSLPLAVPCDACWTSNPVVEWNCGAGCSACLPRCAPLVDAGPDRSLSCATPEIQLVAQLHVQVPIRAFEWQRVGSGTVARVPCISVREAGTYIAIVSGVNGCTVSDTVIVTGDAVPPVVSLSGAHRLTCDAPEATLAAHVSSGRPPYTYIWEGPCGTVIGSESSITVSEAGAYTVKVTGANGCTASAGAEVGLDTDVPKVDAGFAQRLTCATPTATLAAEVTGGRGPYSYAWASPSGELIGTSAAVVVDAPGGYTITVTGANGCSASDIVTVDQDIAIPVVRAEVDHVITCASPEATLSVYVSGESVPSEVQWFGPDGGLVGSDPCVSVTLPGSYTAVVTAANGCSAGASVFVEEDREAPVVEAVVDQTLTCSQTQVTVSALVTEGVMPCAFLWSNDEGEALGCGPTLAVEEPGSYTVTVTGANGCSTSDTVIVEQDIEAPSISTSVGGVLTCAVTEVVLSVETAGGRPPFAIHWSGPDGQAIGITTNVFASEAGTYTVTVTGSNGCSASRQVVVEQDVRPPTVDAGPDVLLTLERPQATLIATVSDCEGPYTVTWTDAAGADVANTDSVIIRRAGTYRATVIGGNGCAATDEVVVNSTTVHEVMLESSIEGLAVFGQLTMDGVPIPDSAFCLRVEPSQVVDGEEAVASISLTDLEGKGFVANGAEIAYIIPGNAMVRFSIHQEQFLVGKRYYLLHLPTDPPGEAAVAFF